MSFMKVFVPAMAALLAVGMILLVLGLVRRERKKQISGLLLLAAVALCCQLLMNFITRM